MGNNEITVTLTAEAVETILKLLVKHIEGLEFNTEWLTRQLHEAEKQKEAE